MPRPKSSQKQVNVFIFEVAQEAIENAAYLTGWRSDLDRAVVSTKLHDGEKWLTAGTELKNRTGKGTLRLFQVTRPVGEGSATYALETYEEGYCLWCLDDYRNGTVFVLDHTMEDMAGWDERNDVSYSVLNLSADEAVESAALN